jgi:hypothetical protein
MKLMRMLNARMGYGRWMGITIGGSHYTFTMHSISGLKMHRFETTLGLAVYFDKVHYNREIEDNGAPQIRDYLLYIPQISLGYRYQKPAGKLMFRACAGIPYFQVSLGLAF